MDIKNVNQNLVSNRSNEQVKSQAKDSSVQNRSGNSEANHNTDKVTLTSVLSQVKNLEQKAEKVTLDNSARIAELKAAIKSGSYKVDPESVANKLIQTETLFAKL